MAATASSPARPMRADARRNYDRIIAEAARLFTEEGINASLDDIARRAEVGPGTLYRHFPTRLDLLQAVFHESGLEVLALAREQLQATDPEVGLVTWMRCTALHAATFRGLPEQLLNAAQNPGSPLYALCNDMRVAGARLLDRAREAGILDSEVEPDDVFSLVHSVAVTVEHICREPAERPDRVNRLIDRLMSGLRAR